VPDPTSQSPSSWVHCRASQKVTERRNNGMDARAWVDSSCSSRAPALGMAPWANQVLSKYLVSE
jgi:hypothetical protein